MRIRYWIGAKLQQSSLFTNAFYSNFIKAIEHIFYEFSAYLKSLSAARDLQAFLVFPLTYKAGS